MAIAPASDETQERIKLESDPHYTYRVSADYRYVLIGNGATEKPYKVSVLEFMENNSGLPAAVRDMAREALEELQRQKANQKPGDMIKIDVRKE